MSVLGSVLLVAGAGAIGAGAGGATGAAIGAEGAGATAPVVAGRFGHPTRKRVRARRGTTIYA